MQQDEDEDRSKRGRQREGKEEAATDCLRMVSGPLLGPSGIVCGLPWDSFGSVGFRRRRT
eukprot:5053550-Pyramimonas_sp.AAC.1